MGTLHGRRGPPAIHRRAPGTALGPGDHAGGGAGRAALPVSGSCSPSFWRLPRSNALPLPSPAPSSWRYGVEKFRMDTVRRPEAVSVASEAKKESALVRGRLT